MNNYLVSKFIAEYFYGFKLLEEVYWDRPDEAKAIKHRTHGCTHQGPEGGYYTVPDYYEIENTMTLVEDIQKRCTIFSYTNMKEGKWGHFVTIRYMKSPFAAWHSEIVEASGNTFQEAVCHAALQLGEAQPYESVAPFQSDN